MKNASGMAGSIPPSMRFASNFGTILRLTSRRAVLRKQASRRRRSPAASGGKMQQTGKCPTGIGSMWAVVTMHSYPQGRGIQTVILKIYCHC